MTLRNSIRQPFIGAGLLFITLLLMPSVSLLAQTAPPVDYRDTTWISSRNLIWVIAQVHLLFGGFVLGVPIFAWMCELIGVRTGDLRYDHLAKEFTKLIVACFEMTATLGIILLFSLRVLYPNVWNYLTDIFLPTYYLYLLLFVGEAAALYLYWSKWETMRRRKVLHLFVGFLLNIFGFLIMIVPNTWATFQASPVVLTETMGTWERVWAAVNNPTWWPVNIHRLIANVVLGGFVCGAYAAIRYLGAQTQEEKGHYDWMGYVGNFIGIFGLLPLPFAGYWLMMEIYRYNQQMGITLMGGFLSWLFILQAALIGVLFLGANYYFWLGLAYRTAGSERYKKYIVTMLVTLLVGFGIWMTPHSLVASLQEAREMGGAHHPLLGVFGVMSAKMTVVNLMILTTFISFLLYWRADKQETVKWAKGARAAQLAIFTAAAVYVIWAGIYGYFVPAVVRIYTLSVSQVLAVLAVLVLVTTLTFLSFRSAKRVGVMTWGRMPVRAQYALILNAVIVVLTMTLMGYARSASRVHWHIYGVLQDTSPYAYTPALGPAAVLMSLCTFLFFCMVAFIFWSTNTVRYKGFSTQYFFIAPFILWLVSLPERLSTPTAQVSERPRYFRKVLAAVCGFLLAFAYLSYQIPQQPSLPPEKESVNFDRIPSQRELVRVGQKIFFGKGQCALCHSIGPSHSPRCPDLQGIGGKLTREFIYESLTQPERYIYIDYTTSPPKKFPATMPHINKPPIGLSEPELLSVIAFVQSLGGEVTVSPEEVRALVADTDDSGASQTARQSIAGADQSGS